MILEKWYCTDDILEFAIGVFNFIIFLEYVIYVTSQYVRVVFSCTVHDCKFHELTQMALPIHIILL